MNIISRILYIKYLFKYSQDCFIIVYLNASKIFYVINKITCIVWYEIYDKVYLKSLEYLNLV